MTSPRTNKHLCVQFNHDNSHPYFIIITENTTKQTKIIKQSRSTKNYSYPMHFCSKRQEKIWFNFFMQLRGVYTFLVHLFLRVPV